MTGEESRGLAPHHELMLRLAVLAFFTAITFTLCIAAIAATLGVATGIGPIEGVVRVFGGISKFIKEVFTW